MKVNPHTFHTKFQNQTSFPRNPICLPKKSGAVPPKSENYKLSFQYAGQYRVSKKNLTSLKCKSAANFIALI